jgi:glutathione S-transferase
MTPMTLYSGPLSMFGAKAQIACLEKGLPFELVMVAYTREHGYEPKHPQVLRVNPKRQVPVLIHGGVEIFDSTQIFEYLEDLRPQPALWPSQPAARAHARLMELKSDEVFFPPVIRLMGLQDRLAEPAAAEAIAQVLRFYSDMEAALEQADYLAGAYSYADIAFYMAQIFATRMGAPMSVSTPRLMEWRLRLGARPAVHQVTRQLAASLTHFKRPIPDFIEAILSLRQNSH